ncbi:MAG: aldo/keto reductase [Opitutaceae bacterium]|nr:aldo/keto reductase [Opitutaceae bacterium]MBP9912699.1 aldo/keto reductase [Opitutaceae bacterium]
MQYRQLGATDLNVSRICFGCWQLSPAWWGEVPVAPWAAAVQAALDCGVNFIDTADAYGDGLAETELGKLFQRERYRDRFLVATKFHWNFTDGPARFPDTTRAYILRACEASLRRLQTDRIDLYQIHAWDPITRPDEVAAAFQQLRAEGKVRWFGVSNLNPEQMELYRAHFDLGSLQPPYSLLARDIEARELPYCLQHNVGVLSYSSLQRGLLGGRYTPQTRFTDHRATTPLFHGKGFEIVLATIEDAKAIAAELGLTMPQLAVRWVLTHPAITSAIVGVKKPEHITGIVQAAEAPLAQEVWHRLAALFAKAKRDALSAAK